MGCGVCVWGVRWSRYKGRGLEFCEAKRHGTSQHGEKEEETTAASHIKHMPPQLRGEYCEVGRGHMGDAKKGTYADLLQVEALNNTVCLPVFGLRGLNCAHTRPIGCSCLLQGSLGPRIGPEASNASLASPHDVDDFVAEAVEISGDHGDHLLGEVLSGGAEVDHGAVHERELHQMVCRREKDVLDVCVGHSPLQAKATGLGHAQDNELVRCYEEDAREPREHCGVLACRLVARIERVDEKVVVQLLIVLLRRHQYWYLPHRPSGTLTVYSEFC